MLRVALVILFVCFPVLASAQEPAEPAEAEPAVGPLSLRLAAGIGFGDRGMAARTALEGETWLNDSWGLGGSVGGSAGGTTDWNEPEIIAYNFRQAFFLVPEAVYAVGPARSRLLLRGGLGPARIEWFQLGCVNGEACPSKPGGSWDAVATLAADYLLAPQPVALTLGLRGERLLSSGGWSSTLNLSVGWSGP